MVDYREILRLSSEGNSQRQIAASVGSSHHTVSEVLTTAKLKGIEWSNDDSITNEMLQSILFPDKYAAISGTGLRVHSQRTCKASRHNDAPMGGIQRKMYCCRKEAIHDYAIRRQVSPLGKSYQGNNAYSPQARRFNGS